MKKITFCVLMILSSVLLGFSQVSIGVGTTIYTGLPFEPVNLYSYSQTIYRASDINASGTITSLKWHFTGVDALQNSQDITVYLAHTTKNAFNSDTDWLSLNDLTLVYTGNIEVTESGWITIPFDTGFTYNGTQNLIVAVKENHPGNDSNYDEFYNSVGPENTSIASWSHFADSNPNPANPPAGNRMPYYPNIIFEGITQACPTPFNVHVQTLGSSNATITWDSPVNTPSGGSQYYISTSPLQPGSDTLPIGSILSGNTIALTDLSPGATHYLWVRSVCDNGVMSPWSAVYTFITNCLPKTEIFEGFADSAPALPNCWAKIVRGAEVNEFASVEITDYAPYIARLTNGNDAHPTDDIMLISPELSNMAAGTHRLKINARDTGGDGAPITLQIVTLSENTPDAGYTVFYDLNTESSFTGTDYIIDFSSYEGTDRYIGFRLNAGDWGSIVWIDNIRWEPIPPCPDVDLTGFAAGEITETTAALSWSNDGADSFQLSYTSNIEATNPALQTLQAATEVTATLEDLEPNTVYKAWIRSVCTEGNGVWIGPITFRTKCEGITAFNENFDASENFPDCWTKLINGPTLGSPTIYVAGIDWLAYSTPNSISLGSGYSDTDGADNIILVAPKLSNMGAGTHRFKFRAYSGSPSADDIQVVTLSSNTSTDGMTVVGTFTSSPDMAEHIVDFSNLEGIFDTFIGIRMNASTPSSTVYIDNVVWELLPPCPDLGTVSISNITTDSAILSWTPGGDETQWQIAYGPVTATDPAAQTLFTSTTLDEDNFIASAELSELAPATEYKIWVRSMCGSLGNGQWSAPVTFKTNCLPITAINENFESVTTPQLPACWSKILRGPTLVSYAVVETTTVPPAMASSGTKVGSIYKGMSGVNDDMILITPEVSNLNAGTHRLTFQAHYRNFVGQLEIGTLNSNNADAIFTPFQDIALTTEMQFFEVDFTEYEGTDTFIGFRINTESYHTAILIDDVAWEPVPSCAHLLSVNVSDISDIDAEVFWQTPGEETTWQIAYALSNVTSPEGLTPQNASLNPSATISGLQAGTQYNVWVRSVCGTDFGSWFGPVTFKTDCTAVTSFSQNFDTTATPALPNCWKGIKRGATLASIAVIETAPIGTQSAPNSIVIYKGTSGVNDDLIIVSPKISNAGAGTHKLSFHAMMQNGSGAELQIGTLNGYTNDAVFTPFESVSPTAAFQSFVVDFSAYSGNDHYIGIRLNSNAAHTVAYLDSIIWEATQQETCPAVALINENFDTTAVDTLPACWTEIVRGPSSETSLDAIMVKPMEGASAPNAVNIFKGLSGPTDEQILVLPKVSNLNAGTHKLSVYLAGPPCQIEVGTLNSNASDAVFTLKQTLDVTTDWTQNIVDFTNYNGSDTYIGLRLNSGQSPFVSMYMDNIVWSSALSTGTFNNAAFTYYPNPVKDVLHLNYDKSISHVAVYNLLGQEVLVRSNPSSTSQIDMSALAAGTYLVKVTSENAQKTIKVIKQ